jgi:hypothetical protein
MTDSDYNDWDNDTINSLPLPPKGQKGEQEYMRLLRSSIKLDKEAMMAKERWRKLEQSHWSMRGVLDKWRQHLFE